MIAGTVLEWCRRFFVDRRGHFALMMAIMSLPLLMAVGTAIDWARILEYKARLANAADAAALASIASGSVGRNYAYDLVGNGEIPPGEKDADVFFRANFVDDDIVTITSVTVAARKESTRLVAELTYRAEVPILFGGLFNISKVTISGTAAAEIKTDAAIDFYLLLDNTPSMGVGATTWDIDTLMANTPDKCAFACHALNDSENYYNLAKDIGVQMRIDVVRQATQKLTDTAKNVRKYQSQFRMAVYSFGEAATSIGLTSIAKLSSDMNKIKTSTAALDLMTIPYQNYDSDQQTSFDNTLVALEAKIPNPGSGLGGAEPQKGVFFVSDGVGDSYKPTTCTKKTTGGRCQEPIDPKFCQRIKARGVKIAVLYTTYLPLPANAWYNSWIKPFQSEIATRMEECATPGLYFEVSPSEGIAEAMDALFLKTLATLRLVG